MSRDITAIPTHDHGGPIFVYHPDRFVLVAFERDNPSVRVVVELGGVDELRSLQRDLLQWIDRRPSRNDASYCVTCRSYTYNGPDHVCIVYDGPPCDICGEPTTGGTYAAPGIGTWRECRAGHRFGEPPILMEPEDTV